MADLKVIYPSNSRDIPASLRRLAEDIEKDVYGKVHGCAFVLDTSPPNAFYWGDGEAGPNGFLLLHTGAQLVMKAVTANHE